jgi:hypothetical protein
MALDCWKAVADTLPPELTLKILSFDRGKKLSLSGTAGKDDVPKLWDFNTAMRNYKLKDKPLFSKVKSPDISPAPGGQASSWSFVCDLKRTGVDE